MATVNLKIDDKDVVVEAGTMISLSPSPERSAATGGVLLAVASESAEKSESPARLTMK